jgi:hypothetical protein
MFTLNDIAAALWAIVRALGGEDEAEADDS